MVSLRGILRRSRRRSRDDPATGRYRSLFENAAEGMYVSRDGVLVAVNRAMASMFGHPSPEAMLASSSDAHSVYAHPDEREAVVAAVAEKGSVTGLELELRRVDGSTFWGSVGVRSIREPGHLALEGSIDDITARKDAERAREDAYRDLSDMVQSVARRNEEMRLLNEMASHLQFCRDEREMFAVHGRYLPWLFPRQSGALYLSTGSERLEATVRWGDWSPPRFLHPEGCRSLQPVEEWDSARGQPMEVCDHLPSRHGSVSICLPMTAESRVLGALSLVSHGETSDGSHAAPQEAQLGTIVADHLALALRNLRLREELREQSLRDPLTDLFNRRYMDEALKRELHRAERTRKPVSVIALDIDHFKRFNDEFGHGAGDAALRGIARLLASHIRKSDIPCRSGGEEFLLILPDCSLGAALGRAELIRERVRHLKIRHGGSVLPDLSFSMGVACTATHGSDPLLLLEAADRGLYAAKAGGRDRVEVREADPQRAAPRTAPVRPMP